MTHKPLAIAIAWAYLGTATGGYDRTAGEYDFLPGIDYGRSMQIDRAAVIGPEGQSLQEFLDFIAQGDG